MKRKVTYQEVARYARVSISTVSRVANGKTFVNPQIEARVRRAALKLGLELRRRRNKSQALAFILSNREMLHPFHSHVLVGAEAASSSHNYNLLFTCLRYPPSKSPDELQLPAILETAEQISGFVLAGTNSSNLLDLLSERGFPFVVLGNNVVGEWEPKRHDVVWFDDIQGAYEVTQYLRRMGHRDIWFVGNRRLPWYARRYEGYRRGMEEAGLPPHVSEFDSTDDAQLGYLATKSILDGKQPVSAIFAADDRAAQAAYKALDERELRVPEDVSIAGFNDIDAVNWHPPLTSVRVYTEQIGRRMVEFLLKRIAEPEQPWQDSVIPTRLIKRESCARFSPAIPHVALEGPSALPTSH